VIALQIKQGNVPPLVWDLDSTLPFTSPLPLYVSETIRPSFQLFSDYNRQGTFCFILPFFSALMGILVLYSLFVDVSNLQLIEMQVQAYMGHMIVATSHIVSFKKLKFIYAGVVIVAYLVYHYVDLTWGRHNYVLQYYILVLLLFLFPECNKASQLPYESRITTILKLP